MDHLTIALILIGIGVLLLAAEVFVPTGGFLVVAALFFFAFAVGIILYYGTLIEGVVAVIGLAVGLPAVGYAAVSAWRRMSLETALEEPDAPPAVAASELEMLKGRTGKTVSPMRPSGSVEFDGRRYDALTEGVMLDAGVWVRCVGVKWGQVIVRRMEAPADVADIDPHAAPPPGPKAEPPPGEEPGGGESRAGGDDDFDIGLR